MIPLLGEEGAFYPRDRAWHPPANTPGYKSTTLRAPRHALLSLGQTKSELTGPTFGHGILNPLDNDLIRNFSQDGGEASGQRMIVYGQVLDETVGYVLDELRHPAGGFYSAEDADSEGVEGRFYVWTPEQITAALGDEDWADEVMAYYGVTPGGNFEGATILNRLAHPGDLARPPRIAHQPLMAFLLRGAVGAFY